MMTKRQRYFLRQSWGSGRVQRNRGLARFLKQDIYRGGGIKWSNTNVLISPVIFCKNAHFRFRSKNNEGGGRRRVYMRDSSVSIEIIHNVWETH